MQKVRALVISALAVAYKAGKRQVSKNKSEIEKCIDEILNSAYEVDSDKTMGFVGLTGKKLSLNPSELGKLNEVLSEIKDQEIPKTFTNFCFKFFIPLSSNLFCLFYMPAHMFVHL